MIKSQMAQEERMDFKALKAKFQDEDLLLKQPKSKPAVPEKPKVKVVLPPPPQSPTHYLPAGARPSLLSSINQSLDGKSSGAPRVVFKENKKDSKKPLIPPDSKKDKNEGKVKKSKEKTIKVRKEKVSGDSSDQKQKNGKVKKESTLDLVPATPPPKAATAKKGFLGFKMTSKRGSAGIQSESILDTLSSDVPGQVPLIPVPSDFGDRQPGPETSTPKALLPNIPNLPGSGVAAKVTPPIVIPASPDFTPPPAFIPDFPVPLVSPPESETPLKLESPSLPVYQPESPDENILSLLSILPSPPPSFASPCFPPVASPPSPAPPAEPEIAAEAFVPDMEKSPFPVIDPPPATPSPKAQHPISALSALGRAEDMSPGKRTPSSDLRIFNALEKARRKKPSTLTSPNTTRPPTPLPEEEQSPPIPGLDLPPIDYEDQARKALSKPAQVNGLDHEQAAPVLEGISEEVSESIPELMVVPPPPPKRPLPDLETLGPPPEKPRRPPSVNLSEFLPPPHLEDFVVHADPQLSQPGSTDQPEFGEGVSGAHSPELPVADWANGEITGQDSPDGENLPEFYTNGMTTPVPEIQAEPVIGNQDYPGQQAEIWAQVDNGVYESTENVYEDIPLYAIKKKGKNDGGKKRKGPPKNPYVEAAQEANEEKSKTGRFSKNDKKALAEGPDEKELKKKEKQRLEKEKKEQKEKQEREKKEQKEREKKENEMKKKFKITGQEEAIYEAKVTVTNKGRKNDLPVKDGDVISIIRTTNCPKGKWLAKDGSNNYGYVTVDHVELDIKEMLELGKKAASNHRHSSSIVEAEITSTGNRASNHYPMSAESFTDDSEEWTADDDEPQSPPAESADALAPIGHARTLSNPETGNRDLTANHQHSRSDTSTDGPHVQARHQALQKLATFFHASKPLEQAASSTEADAAPVLEEEEAFQLPEASPSQEIDFDSPDMIILPPPELYADMIEE